MERGEIPASTNIEVAVDLVYGPLWHRLLHGHAPLNDRFAQDVVDMALHGIQRVPDRAPAAGQAGSGPTF
jgi:tetracycline repressor-like protein